MKTSIIKTAIILTAIGFTVNANAAKGGINVPEKIVEEFAAKYPQAKLKDWKIAKAGYKAEFKLNHKKYTAVYASDGTLLKSETKLSWTRDMPLEVKKALKKGKYAAYHVDEIKKVNTAGEIQFILIIDNHGGSTMATEGYGAWEDYQVVFENNGILTSVRQL
jgi:hypothetical protein